MNMNRPLPAEMQFIGLVDAEKFDTLGLSDSILKFKRPDGASESPLFSTHEKAAFFGSIAFGENDYKFAAYPLETVGSFIEFFEALEKKDCKYVTFDPQHGLADRSLLGRSAEVSEFKAFFPADDK